MHPVAGVGHQMYYDIKRYCEISGLIFDPNLHDLEWAVWLPGEMDYSAIIKLDPNGITAL